jgi:hypothetical protein
VEAFEVTSAGRRMRKSDVNVNEALAGRWNGKELSYDAKHDFSQRHIECLGRFERGNLW